MKRTRYFLSLVGLLYARGWAQDACTVVDAGVIRSHTTCVDSEGIALSTFSEHHLTFECLRDPRVQRACGLDGRMTRSKAYALWLQKLKAFESRCADNSGVFSFRDPNFIEPTNETFCSVAKPVLRTGYFENAVCNLEVDCDAVEVRCQRPCSVREAKSVDVPDSESGAKVSLRPVRSPTGLPGIP